MSEKGNTFFGFSLLLILVILLLGGVVFAYLLFGRMGKLDEQMDDVGERLSEVERKVDHAVAQSEQASVRAFRAEQNVLDALQSMDHALAVRDRAAMAMEEAQGEAEVAKQEAEQARREAERIRKEREEELNQLQEALNRIAETRRTALGLVMNLGSDTVRFDFDKADLRSENKELLSRIAGVLLTHKGYRIQIFGHTDDVGTDEYNLELSRRRAQSVRDYLVEAGVSPDIVTTEGFGKSNPLVPGNTAEARSKNRRVEIGIVDSVIRYTHALPADQ